jgi:hypothetical protein
MKLGRRRIAPLLANSSPPSSQVIPYRCAFGYS